MAAKKAKKTTKKTNKAMSCSTKCGGFTDSCGGCSYFLGFIGAAIYYNVTTVGFWAGVLGILKGMVWPAFLVFELLRFLGA